ncbi:MAG: TrkA family potassium uptake protein [Planctomycetes bacterium]|nr:TrkA family potassium uptake protein [Planctomycetota bacterium]
MGKQNDVRQPPRRIGVFGLGRFGYGLAVRLSELGGDVLAIDANPDPVEQIDERVSRAICLDVTDEFAMQKANVENLDLAVVCIGRNIQSSLLATAVVRRLGARQIWVRAIDQNQAEILEAMGVTKIVSLEQEMALQVAQSIMMPGTHMIAPITVHHSLAEVKAKPEFVGKTLGELNLRKEFGVNVVAIKSRKAIREPNGPERIETVINDLPRAEDEIKEGDVLVVIGADDNILELQTEG